MARNGRSMVRMAAGVFACVTVLCQGALAQGGNEKIGITEVAPLDSFIVVTVPDWPAAKAAMTRSEFGKYLAEPQVREFVVELFKEGLSADEGRGGPWAWFADNVDADDLHEPTGPLGLALFAAKVPDPADAAKTVNRVQGMLIAEFGEQGAAMMDTTRETLERLEREGRIKLEEDDHDDVDILVITVVVEEDPELAAMREQWGGEPDRTMDAFKTLMLAEAGGRILISTDRKSLEAALDRIGGDPLEAVGENRSYRAALAQHPADQHVMFVGLASEFVRTSARETFEGAMSMAPVPVTAGALVDALGVGAVEAFGMGIRFDTEAGTMEQTIGLLAPRKAGLLTLLDSGMQQFSPPAFVPADARSAWSAGVRFDRIPEIVRNVAKALPEEMREQVLTGFETGAAPIFASLGNEVHVVQTLSRPLGPESAGALVAIRLKDPLTLANTLNGFAGMAGLTPRNFEGNQLFESLEGGGPTIGIGFDHVFIGPGESVENAMRLASRPDAPKLADSERFKRSTAPLAPGAAIYYYDNMAESLAWEYWTLENAERLFEAQIADWGLDDETREEFLANFREEQGDWAEKLPPFQLILDHFSDSVMEIRSTPDGFRGRSVILRPAPR